MIPYFCFLLIRSPYDLETVIILRGSDQYKFIHVEDYGYVVSYAPRTSDGDHHHLLFVKVGAKTKHIILTIAVLLDAQNT